jgi:protein SCO1/2
MRLLAAVALVVAPIALCVSARAMAQTHGASLPAGDVGIDEKLGGFVPLEVGFVDSDSDSVYLRDVVEKPTVLTLVYYHCPNICMPFLSGVADVVTKTNLELGKDYNLLTVSFDPYDSPVTASRVRKEVAAHFRQGLPENAWWFLSGDSAAIARLTDSVGFRVKRVDKDFAHGTALIVLSPDGKVIRYLYGMSYMPFDLKMAVAEASAGKVVPSISRVLSYCFSYDPKGRRYVLDVTRVVGALAVLGGLGFVLSIVLLERKRKRA